MKKKIKKEEKRKKLKHPNEIWKISEKDLEVIEKVVKYSQSKIRSEDLFKNKSYIGSKVRAMKRGLKGVENIYTEHEPLLHRIIESVCTGKLKEPNFPFVGGDSASHNKKN